MTKTASDRDPLFGEVRRNWGWMLALGLVYLLLGGVGLAMLFGFAVVSIQFIGVLLLVGGVAQALETLKSRGWRGIVWHLAIAALYVAAGLVIVYDPEVAPRLISLAIGVVLIGVGVARGALARQLRASGEGWIGMTTTAVIALALGAAILLKWPVSGLFIVALFAAVELILQGWSAAMLALAARRSGGVSPAGSRQGG